jgi:hypothetical protein
MGSVIRGRNEGEDTKNFCVVPVAEERVVGAILGDAPIMLRQIRVAIVGI